MKKSTIKNSIGSHITIMAIALLVLSPVWVLAQTGSPDENYVKTTTYKKPFASSQQNPTPDKATVEITYFDGLGRPKQKIAHQQAGNGDDLITHIEYDGFGRQAFDYLPYKRDGGASLYIDGDGYSETTGFYSDPTNGPTTSNPWSEKIFEDSPLNRVLEQAAPGDPWDKILGHTVKFEYETNTANEVHHFSVGFNASGKPILNYDQRYPLGQLYKTVTKDENWLPADGQKGTISEYKDKMGRLVLKRHYEVPIDGLLTEPPIALDTYYVYDAYGNLTFVLPPKLSAMIVSGGSLIANHSHFLDHLGYQYQYDHRNRVIIKKIPGKTWEYMVYDALDRLTATGPALSPFGDQAEGWLHTKYDIHNRVAYTLWKQGTVDETQRDALANALPTYISEHRTTGTSSVNNVSFSYSNQVAPTAGYHVLTVNYYDDYGYTGAPSSIPATVGEGDVYVYYKNTAGLKPKGLPTGSWVRQLETSAQVNAIKSYSLYDSKARPVRVHSANSASGYTRTDTKFDFIGNPEYTKTQHKKDASGFLVNTKNVFTYTDQSRPLKHTHKVNSDPEQLLSLNQYDLLGRLIEKKVGSTVLSGAAPLQIVDYKYNVRGWLLGINRVENLIQPGGGPMDLFAFKINYTDVDDGINGAVEPLYNGNIAETFWKTSSDNILRKYGYAYDHQNRLMDAYYQKPSTSIPRSDSYSTHYTYDRNGNILSLQRNGEQDDANAVIAIDALVYTYDDGNKLMKVKDNEQHPAGYNDAYSHLTNPDFEYDVFGNLTLDRDKDITDITYNHLSLPLEITFGTGGKIEYFYDATGIKLKKKVTDGTTITTTQYMDGFQYTDNALDFFPHAEGYVKAVPNGIGGPGGPTSFSFKYVFTYTDHLGNIRLKYAQDPSNNNQISILEEDHYYPYGLKHKGYSTNHFVFFKGETPSIVLTPVNPFLGDSYKYKFGGKEQQTEFDINTYDFGARNYDPALARWMNIDPLAEQMRRHSPYNYAFNNPIYFIDPDGMAPGGFSDGYVEHNLSTTTGAVDVTSFNLTVFDGSGNTLDSQIVTGSDNASVATNGKIFTGESATVGINGLGGEEYGDGSKFKKFVEEKGGTEFGFDEYNKIKDHITNVWADGKGKAIDLYGYSRGGNTAVLIANNMKNVLFTSLVLFDAHILDLGGDSQRFTLTGTNVREVHNYYQHNPRTWGKLLPFGDNPYQGSPIIKDAPDIRQYGLPPSAGANVYNYDLTGKYYSPGRLVNHNNIVRHAITKYKL